MGILLEPFSFIADIGHFNTTPLFYPTATINIRTVDAPIDRFSLIRTDELSTY